VKAATPFRSRRSNQQGFTLIEMLMATAIVIVGLVAVAQLVPASVLLNSNNRNDGTALVFAQRQIEAMREQPLTATTFSDPNGVYCPTSQTCSLGDPTQTGPVGNSVITFQNSPIIDYTADPVAGYSFIYTDPNDPLGTTTDVRWAIITTRNPTSLVVTSRRIILGVFRRGMSSPSLPITLDVMVEK
jgi:prepilin-type N-terminal cleavage/methylation domain-containing protein